MAKPSRAPDPNLTPEDGAKLDALRCAVEEGARELEAGLGLDGEAVMAELRARFGTVTDEA
ncbi:hypothetical protein [Azospirillum sp.]|uniref:hypothetical protein n=1 Tax=Azospirillum sp. TaxID=34012 RepID=UPI003D70EC85